MARSASPTASLILAEVGLGHLPEEWGILRVEDLLSEDRGISVGVMYPGEHDPLGVPLIRAGDLIGSRVNPRPELRITREKNVEYKRTELAGGELLISLVGDVGRCAVVSPEMAGWNAARAIAVLRFKAPTDAHFARLCLVSPPLQHLMRVWSTTTVQATLNLKEIRQLPLPWPPRVERESITRIMGALEDRIEITMKETETLEAMARALFRSWFVDFDPVRAKMEGRPTGLPDEVAALFPERMVESPVGEVPEGWALREVGDVVEVGGGSTPSTKEERFWNGTIHWATPKDLAALDSAVLLDTERKLTEEGLAETTSGLLPKGTLLLSSRAPIGYLAITEVPVAVNQGFITMVCRKNPSNHYMLHWAKQNHESIVARANGTTFLEISKKSFRPIPVIVPDAEIMAEFSRLVEPMHNRVAANLRQSQTLVALRDTLLPRLLSGEVRIPVSEEMSP